MKIIINLKYHDRLIDAQVIDADHRSHITPDVDIDITRVVDQLLTHCVKRHIAKLAKASKRAVLAAKKTDTAKPKPKGTSKP